MTPKATTTKRSGPDSGAIRVHGARVNNLCNIDVTIPKRRLTVFTGVSGSGKSSLVFGTIGAESQRLVNETYPAFIQGFMGSIARPDVDRLEGLNPAIVVDQERIGGDVRSTVGTASDANALLRVLFSRLGTPHIGPPQAFSFNVASVSGAGAVNIDKGGRTARLKRSFSIIGGMCPRCEGRGSISELAHTQVYDAERSLNEGAILVPGYSRDGWYGRIFAGCGFFDPDKPVGTFTKRQLDALLYKEPTRITVDGINLTYEGVIAKLRRTTLAKDPESLQPHVRAFVARAVTFGTCPDCDGTRLAEATRSSRIAGVNIAEVCAMEVADAARWVRTIEDAAVAPLVDGLAETLEALVDIGLGYLSLERPAGTLSGGESQRLKMVRHLGSPLTDVTYVFDEPSIGLHPHDVAHMNELLLALRDKGNTVLVVEHDPEVIGIADHVVDIGPGAGRAGGRVCFEGTVDALRAADTVTGRHLGDRARLKDEVRAPTGVIEVRGADAHNLRGVDVDVPLGVLCVVTGVAGSGKSSLIETTVAVRDEVATVDQAPIRGSRRSNPATTSGALDPIRKAFAKANGVKPGLFSANSDGACPNCGGNGVIFTDLAMVEGVSVTCEVCEGRRFSDEVLGHTLGGHSIADVFAMSVAEAAEVFAAGDAAVPKAHQILTGLLDVGLGYVTLGQPLPSLSGGERQRLKLAGHLGGKAQVIVLDEPTTGLHLADVANLLALLDRIVDAGRSVIVIEHHLAVMAHADWILDLGPGAGHEGGRVVFEGTPAALVADGTTLTGAHLAAELGR